MTTATELPKTWDMMDLKEKFTVLVNEVHGPIQTAQALHAEISRLHAEDDEACPAMEAHLKSLGIVLTGIYLSIHEMKVRIDG